MEEVDGPGAGSGTGSTDGGPVFLRCVTDQTAKVGTRARFLAEIISSSTLTVTWLFNSQPVDLQLDAGTRYKILQEGNFYCKEHLKGDQFVQSDCFRLIFTSISSDIGI